LTKRSTHDIITELPLRTAARRIGNIIRVNLDK